MTDLGIEPVKLTGPVTVPPSKSLAHRAIICASLAKGRSEIKNIQYSDDITATIEGMQTLGAVIQKYEGSLSIEGIKDYAFTQGRTINCNESGSTLRFLIPLATLFEGETHFTGQGKLGTRPLATYQAIFEKQGLRYNSSNAGELDLTVEGSLQPGAYEVRGDVSSQFITGLLLTLPLLNAASEIRMTTALESEGYVDLTLSMLESFGIHIDFDKERQVFSIEGNQVYRAQDITIDGDYSQAAFFLSARALGNPVSVEGLNERSLQGDRAIVSILEQLGGIKLNDVTAVRTIDGSQCPDIIPVVALVAALTDGKTEITNLERLRIKESDRLEATQKELSQLGADIEVDGDSLVIKGVDSLKGNTTVWSHKDHRIAMMLAVASTVCVAPIVIKDTGCVAKSYPDFWEVFEQLGGKSSEWNLG
ncbi:3-phosphoshikimate 1-carboxyvinyltransferase [Alkalibacterium sp. 20]|uniref:3-phosphoshikimate 1-carboxyvinyltransferase n=1 Tax=Alkalibacterium sp. 20 TaxID=1798803 RepID=UPI0008FFF342|nr:3-phosphoshikimate 1-carboxyvinyltransferase [Alkalibacterium sp. 20]OJF97119.1 3-phosphoshikimate 1-carboxyvinyltransferase [Alkalibacterium sp. 20]